MSQSAPNRLVRHLDREREAPHRRDLLSVRSAAVALGLLTLALTGCRRPMENASESIRPEANLSFDRLYGENCAACHGAKGDHGAAISLSNPEYLAWIDEASLRNITANGEKGVLMPGFARSGGGTLTDQQIDILVRGIRSWGKPNALNGATPPPYHPASPGNAAAGQAVYTAACASCHGADRQHPGKSGSILDGTYLALVNEQTIRSTIVPGRPDIGQPDWRNDIPGHPLTDAQVTDVAAWLIAQRPAHPGHPYPLTPNTQPTSERPGEQQPLAEKNDNRPGQPAKVPPGTRSPQ